MEKCQKDLLTEEINLWESKSIDLIRERAEKMTQELFEDTRQVVLRTIPYRRWIQ